MNSREFLGRERDLAMRYGLRKSDVLFQMVRCTGCGTESMLRSRFNRHEFTSVGAAERRVLEVIHRPVGARCSGCGATELDGLGDRHVFLMYSERARAHLALTFRMTREDDERVKVLRQVWFVPDVGSAEEIEVEGERLDDFWADSRIRARAVDEDPEAAAEALQRLAAEQPEDPFLLRELGNCLMDAGRTARALGAYELSLEADRDQPSTLRKVGRLYVGFGQAGRGSELLIDAWRRTEDPTLLPEILRATYRGRRDGALVKTADELLEIDGESVLARKAIATARSVTDVGEMRDAWEDLAEAAARSGDRRTEHVAAFWKRTLSLPVPDWRAKADREQYVAQLRQELADWGFEVVERPEPLDWQSAEIPIDVQAVAEDGEILLFVVFDQCRTPALHHRIAATIRAAREDERRAGCTLIPLCRQPLGYGAMAMASAAPDTELMLAADADTTMAVADENVASLLVAAERHFGRTLDFSLDSLEEIDAILERLHEDGFGEITFAFQCQIAAYVAEVIGSVVEGAAWRPADEPMDPFVLALPTGEEINLVSKVGKAVRNGFEDGIVHFVGVLLDHVEEA